MRRSFARIPSRYGALEVACAGRQSETPAVFLTPLFCGTYHRSLICLCFSSFAESATPRSKRHGPLQPRPGNAWAAWCLALASCATAPVHGPASAAINPEVAAQLRAMATRQGELERKVERLEAELDASRSSPRRAELANKNAAAPSLVPGNLATVRLSPQAEKAAPPLSTEVALREPADGALEKMLNEADNAVAGDEFAVALKSISTGDVPRGAASLQTFADKHPRDERAPYALLQAGIGLLTYGDPQSAVLAFDRVAQDYPQAREAPEAMMRMADCQMRMKRADRARDVYVQVTSRYPGTPAARAAEAGLKGLADAKAAQ